MLEIKCDFCGLTITTKKNKGGKPKKFRLEENICNACKNNDLNKKWDKSKSEIDKEWNLIENEKKKFQCALLKTQQRQWLENKKKEFFGSELKETK